MEQDYEQERQSLLDSRSVLIPHCGALQTVVKPDKREGRQKGHVLSDDLTEFSQFCLHQAHLLPPLLNVPTGWESQHCQ